jgi:hypothetical protein
MLARSIPVSVLLAALLFAGSSLADPIPDGTAPSLDAPSKPAAAPSARVDSPSKVDAPATVDSPANVDPPSKAGSPVNVDPPPKAGSPVKADSRSKSDSPARAGSTSKTDASARVDSPPLEAPSSTRSRTAAREPVRCSPGRRATKASAAGCPDKDVVAGVSVRKVQSGPHLEVVARDLRLDDTSSERLARIARRYFEATRRRLVVTGGTRTPERQAELMLEKLAHGDDLVALYENKAAVTEIRNIYRESAGARQPKKQLIRAIRDAIVAQMEKGIYISRHLKAGAADVRSRDFKAAQEAAFRAAVADEPGVVLVDERSGAEPHLHLGL